MKLYIFCNFSGGPDPLPPLDPLMTTYLQIGLSNSYTMGCPPVRVDNPRALASGLSYIQVDKHGITILYHLHQCRSRHQELFNAKVGKGRIIYDVLLLVRFNENWLM